MAHIKTNDRDTLLSTIESIEDSLIFDSCDDLKNAMDSINFDHVNINSNYNGYNSFVYSGFIDNQKAFIHFFDYVPASSSITTEISKQLRCVVKWFTTDESYFPVLHQSRKKNLPTLLSYFENGNINEIVYDEIQKRIYHQPLSYVDENFQVIKLIFNESGFITQGVFRLYGLDISIKQLNEILLHFGNFNVKTLYDALNLEQHLNIDELMFIEMMAC